LSDIEHEQERRPGGRRFRWVRCRAWYRRLRTVRRRFGSRTGVVWVEKEGW
jgi:hypothetical protein